MKKLRLFLLATLVLAGLSVTIVTQLKPQVAHAQARYCGGSGIISWGRQECYGYFTNQYLGGKSFEENIPEGAYAYNVNDFVSEVSTFLYTGDTQHQVSMAFVVDTMLGHNGSDFGGSRSAGITFAKNNFAQWEALVRSYDAAGLVKWKIYVSPSYLRQDSAYSKDLQDAVYQTAEAQLIESIQFLAPDRSTVLYSIDHYCFNLYDDTNALPPLKTGDINPPTPASGGLPAGYNTGNTNQYSSCTTVAGHAYDRANPSYQSQISLTYAIGGTVVATDTTPRASTSGTRSWTANTPAVVRNSTSPVVVSGTYKVADGSVATLTGSPITIGPCVLATPTCSGATSAPTALDPGTAYTITANVRYGSIPEANSVMANASTRLFIKVTGPGVNTSLTYTPAQITQVGTLLTVTTAAQPPTGQTGSYLIGYGITGPIGAINCGASNVSETNPPKFPVTTKPYFTVKNGDLSAGAGMSVGGNECAAGGAPANPNAGIVSWNRGSAGAYGGAGTQYGALALGHLQDFATGQGSSLTPSGASFGNTGGDAKQVDTTQGLFGGEFGSSDCTADYFKDVDPSVIQGSQTIGAQAIPNCTGSNAAACRRVIYVNGNVFINGNITFSGSYANASEIPSFSLVVTGNIYIAPTVTRLDGFYIAQPTNGTATNGVIYTCATSASGAPALDNTLSSTCNTALTVNGAFIGRQIWLLRTAGSISSTPAETFNYSPESWLSAPYGNGLSPATYDDYDAITSLPPVL